jgi:hypothetical protein
LSYIPQKKRFTMLKETKKSLLNEAECKTCISYFLFRLEKYVTITEKLLIYYHWYMETSSFQGVGAHVGEHQTGHCLPSARYLFCSRVCTTQEWQSKWIILCLMMCINKISSALALAKTWLRAIKNEYFESFLYLPYWRMAIQLKH